MSELLDELARRLAEPMPRRRALGIFGVTLVSFATAGTASGGRGPLGSRQTGGCGAAYKICEPASQRCFAHCCPKHTTCSFSERSPTTGCQTKPGCCDPCDRERSQPDGKGGCRPGPVPDHCPCAPGQKKCRSQGQILCCDAGEACVTNLKQEGSGSFALGACCKKGSSFCMRGSPARAFCCPPGTRCCTAGAAGGRITGSCCPRLTKTCDGGGCQCKPGHTVKCGNDCCHPDRHKCCGKIKRCVPRDVDCDDAFPNT